MEDEPAPVQPSWDERARALGNVVFEAGRLELVVGFCAKAILAPLAGGTRYQVLANMQFSAQGELVRGAIDSAPFTVLDSSLHKDFKAWWTEGAVPAMKKRNDIVHSAVLHDTSGGMVGHSIKREKRAHEQELKTGVPAVDQMRVTLEDWHAAAEELRKQFEPGVALARRIRKATASPHYAQFTILTAPETDGALNF